MTFYDRFALIHFVLPPFVMATCVRGGVFMRFSEIFFFSSSEKFGLCWALGDASFLLFNEILWRDNNRYTCQGNISCVMHVKNSEKIILDVWKS